MSRRPDRFPLLAALAVAGALAVGASVAADDGDDAWEKEFQAGFAKTASCEKFDAIADLEPRKEKARAILLAILDKQPWYLRFAATSALRHADQKTLDGLERDLAKHSSPLVREGIAIALGRLDGHEHAGALVAALGDKDERVRRAAASALSRHGTGAAVAALIAAWEKEKLVEPRGWYRQALEAATGRSAGARPDAWRAWWKAAEHDWQAPPAPPQPKDLPKGSRPKGVQFEEPKEPEAPTPTPSPDDLKALAEGRKVRETTEVRADVELLVREIGQGAPLCVLPEPGFSTAHLERGLATLDDAALLRFIELPGKAKYRNLQPPGGTDSTPYPIDKLCDGLEALRAARGEGRIALLGHGMGGWVAMRYASLYPKSVSHLILVSTWSSAKTWEDGRARAEQLAKQSGDVELEHYARSQLYENGRPGYMAIGEDDADALERARWTALFADPRDARALLLWPRVNRAREIVDFPFPDFDVAKEKGAPVPTLVFVGTGPRSVWTSTNDMKAIVKQYPGATLVECPGSARMPVFDDAEAFTAAVRAFFKKLPLPKGGKKP